MKWRLLPILAVLLTAVSAHAVDVQKQHGMSDFSCGLNTNYDPLTIKDCEVSSSLNMLFDEDNSADLRQGFSTSISSAGFSYVGSWAFTDSSNISWVVVLSSDAIRAGVPGANFSVKIATVPANATVNAVVAFNKIYFTDQTQGVYYWDGTATTYVVGSPRGKYIDTFRNRLLVTGLASPNQSQVYLSKFLDGSTWTTGTLSTDAAVLTTGLQDNQDVVTGTFSGFNDTAVIFKKQSVWGIFGFDTTDFQIRTLNKEVGCIDQRSIQAFRGGVIFASLRAIEYFDGINAIPISDSIKNLVDPALNTAFNSHTWTQSSQSEFQNGAILPTNGLSTTISAGNVVPSSITLTDTLSADFGAGSFDSGLDTSTVSGAITLKTYLTDVFSSMGNWTERCGGITTSGNVADFDEANHAFEQVSSPSPSGSFIAQYDFKVTAAGNNAVLNFGILNGSLHGYVVQVHISGSDFILSLASTSASGTGAWNDGQSVCSGLGVDRLVPFNRHMSSAAITSDTSFHTIKFLRNNATGDMQVYYDDVLKLAATNSSYTSFSKAYFAAVQAPGIGHWNVDNLFFTAKSGTLTSRVFDTAFSTPTYGALSSGTSGSSATNSWAYAYQCSAASGSGYTSPTAISTGSIISGCSHRRYLIYSTTITATSVSDFPQVTDVSFIAASTGTFYSAVNFASGVSSWDIFSVNKQDNGGTHTFFTRASTSPFTVLSATPTWVAQTANAVVAASTGTYFQMRDDFLITFATHTPTLNDFSFNWFEGTQPPPMASAVHKDRYFLAITTNTSSTGNDSTFVLGSNFSIQQPVWSLWDIRAGTYLVYLGNLYHGNNQANGKFYRDFTGLDDDGAAISAHVWTKDYPLGDITKEKLFDSLYMTTLAQGDETISTSYYLNRDRSTAYSLGSFDTDEQSGLNVIKLPFPLDNSAAPNFGKTISFKWSPSGGRQPVKIFGGILMYRDRMTQ